MPELVIWKNQQIDKMRRDMDRMFNRMCGEFGLSAFPRELKEFPPIEIKDVDDRLICKVDIPDFHPEDIAISITENTLTLKGSMKQNKIRNTEGHLETEHRHSSFSRTLKLSCRVMVDDVKAQYKDGSLYITMPKYDGEKMRALKIEGNEK